MLKKARPDAIGWLMVLALICSCTCAVYAQPGPVGDPPVVRHASDVGGNPQNFAVVQNSLGIVYVGNGEGVLEFDGERWRLLPFANRDTARSLAIDSQDRVYVGGYNTFGYVQRDEFGNAHIVELTHRFSGLLGEREFNDIWRILVAPEGVYFSALRDLFFWDPETDETGYWRHQGRFGALAHYQDQTIAQFRGEGLRRRLGSEWVPLEYTSGLKQLILDFKPLADGSLLALGVDGRWLRLESDRVSEVAMPAALPKSNSFEASLALADGTLVLGAGDGQVYIVDPSLSTVRRFALDSGFISGLAPATDGGFLVSADEAFYRVGWPSAWSVLGAEHGLGNLLGIGRWKKTDFLLTSAGARRLEPRLGSTPLVSVEPWGDELFTALQPIDSERALLGSGHKLLVVDSAGVSEVTDELVYPRRFYPSTYYPGRIYIGTEYGLRYIEPQGDQLRLSPPANQGLEILVSSLREQSPSELWYGSYRHGLWQARLNQAGEIVSQQRFGAEQGLEMGVIEAAEVAAIDGPMIVSTRQGLFRWDGETFLAEDLHGLAALHAPEELLTVVGDGSTTLWAHSAYRILRYTPSHGWQRQPIDQLRRGALAKYRLGPNGRAEFVATRSLLIYAGDQGSEADHQPQVRLRSVSLNWNDGRRENLTLRPSEPVKIAYGAYGISFQFALPDLAYESGRAYRGRLLGYESDYSQWRGSRGYLYSRMSPGTYTLEVQARDGAGQISEIEPYTLIILAPWYRTWWALGAALFMALATLLWLILRATRTRTERTAAEKRQLEATVAIRTRDLAAANQRLEMMAHVDGLTGIANRRRLDAYLASAWQDCRDRGRPLALLAIDVDHFKRFNDSKGHLAGDKFLQDLVPILDRCLRRSEDLLARYGGEEFLAIMPGTDIEIATHVAESMRSEIDSAKLGTTISVGVASAIPSSGDPKRLLAEADEALYAAKDGGRNRVEVASDQG